MLTCPYCTLLSIKDNCSRNVTICTAHMAALVLSVLWVVTYVMENLSVLIGCIIVHYNNLSIIYSILRCCPVLKLDYFLDGFAATQKPVYRCGSKGNSKSIYFKIVEVGLFVKSCDKPHGYGI